MHDSSRVLRSSLCYSVFTSPVPTILTFAFFILLQHVHASVYAISTPTFVIANTLSRPQILERTGIHGTVPWTKAVALRGRHQGPFFRCLGRWHSQAHDTCGGCGPHTHVGDRLAPYGARNCGSCRAPWACFRWRRHDARVSQKSHWPAPA